MEFGLIIGWYWLLFTFTVLVILLMRFRKHFWAKLAIVGFSIQLLIQSLWRAATIFDSLMESMQDFFHISESVGVYAYALICLAIASVPIARHPSSGQQSLLGDEDWSGKLMRKPQHPLVTALLVLVTLNIYWLFWLHRNVKQLREFGSQKLSFTPGQAVGYMFIPLFNIFWFIKVVVVFPQAIRELNNRLPHDVSRSAYSAGFVSLLFICAILTNGLFARFSLTFLLVGDLLLLTAIVYTQRYIRSLWLELTALQTERQTTDQ
jgi:hypothetical protein